MGDLTHILQSVARGDEGAPAQLFNAIYDELRRLAASRMAQESAGQTLQPTALVHEVWLRLGADEQPQWQNRAHFFGAAGEAMRRILVENARRKLRLKRGAGQERIELEESAIQAPVEDEKVLRIHEALETLQQEDPQKAEIVKLRFFAGLSYEEIAALLDVNEKTVRRHWEVAKVRLFQLIRADL